MTNITTLKVSEGVKAKESEKLPVQVQLAINWVKDQAFLIVKKVRQYKKQKTKNGRRAEIIQFPKIHRDLGRVATKMTLNGQTVTIDGTGKVAIPGEIANDAVVQELPIAVGQTGGFFSKLGIIQRPDVPKEVKNLVRELLESKKRPRKIVGDANTVETPIDLTSQQKTLLLQALELNYLTNEQMVDIRFQLTISPFPIEQFRQVHWKPERNKQYLMDYLKK